MTRAAPRRGVTLAECVVALAVSSILLAAVYALLVAGWRAARAQAAAIGVRQNVRAAAATLRAELLGVTAPSGDLVQTSDSGVVLRATRGLAFVCASPSSGAVVLGDSLFSATRAVDPTRDSALLFREGDPLTEGDDRWLHAAITSVRRGGCSDGTGGTQLALAGPSAADLAGVTPGSPLRTFEILEYRRYVDGSGFGWLGVRGPGSGGGWAATSPIAGPLRPKDGVVFGFTDRDGIPAARAADVALVVGEIHGLDTRRLPAPGRPGAAPSADSLTIRVWVGGP